MFLLTVFLLNHLSMSCNENCRCRGQCMDQLVDVVGYQHLVEYTSRLPKIRNGAKRVVFKISFDLSARDS